MTKFSKLFLLVALLLGGWSFSSCEEPDGIEPTPIIKGLFVYPSSSFIIADGEDETVLTVKFDGVDVTDSAFIYVNKKRMKGNRFTTEVPGNYDFFASYKGKVSPVVTVNAANPALYVALPEDSQADKFSDFQHKVLLTEATGTWCGYCPYMIAALELFGEKGSNRDKVVTVATHSGDEFSNAASEAAIKAIVLNMSPSEQKDFGLPSCFVNLNPITLVGTRLSANVDAENLNTMVGMELKEDAYVGIAVATAVSVDSSVVGVRAAVKIGKDGRYRINAWLIEDGVAAYQSGAEKVIDHMHILRGASCASPIQGELLGEACAYGDVIEYYYEFDVTKANVANVANCKVAVLVTTASGDSSDFYVNNVVECHVGESVPFAYN